MQFTKSENESLAGFLVVTTITVNEQKQNRILTGVNRAAFEGLKSVRRRVQVLVVASQRPFYTIELKKHNLVGDRTSEHSEGHMFASSILS